MTYRRFALGLVLALGGLGFPAAIANADAGSNVLVSATLYTPSGPSQSPDTVTVGALQGNPGQCPTYQGGQSMNELGRQGFVDVPLSPNATWSLPTILGCLQNPIPLSAVNLITVTNSNGSPEDGSDSQLTAPDLAPPPTGSDFNDSSEYPVVQALGSLNQYDRPWRGGSQGQSDQDFLDEVQATQDDQPTPIVISVFEGPRLTVTANASRTTVPVGTPVSFSATVSGPDDSGLAYSWNFDGGAANSTEPAPVVTFITAGQYAVNLQVSDSAGGGGAAELMITVGSPAPTATGSHKQTGGGTSRKSHTPTGPRKSGGKHAGAPAGNHQSQSSPSGKTGTTSTSPSATTPTSTSTSSSTTASHPATPASTPSHTTSRTRHPARPNTSRTKPLPPAPVDGPLVTGQLVSDVTLLPAGASPLVRSVAAAALSAPPARQAIRTSRLPALAAILGVAVLLGLGAARELRGRWGWHAPSPGS